MDQKSTASDTFRRPASHPAVRSGRVGALLVNLGTPEATDYWSMRRYLKEFLTDRRVIELSPWIWRPILELFILTTRPSRRGHDYEAIWNREADESPLKTITRAQSERLTEAFAGGSPDDPKATLLIEWAMRYGQPTIDSRLRSLQAQGCDRILLVPLYPQYAAATTATVCDRAFQTLSRLRWQPALRVAPPWHDDPVYIDALARSVTEAIAAAGFQPDMILASFHGTPKSSLLKGDPYYCHCARTARLLKDRLQVPDDRFQLTFQSRFGRSEWLQPYTDETIKALPKQGVKRLCVVTPGFVADCLETIEEIGVENASYFAEAGGERFLRVPCLNEGPLGTDVLVSVLQRELKGWMDFE
jgi:ferrochelatase